MDFLPILFKASITCGALFGVTMWFALMTIFPVSGSMISSATSRPVILSCKDSIFSCPSESSVISKEGMVSLPSEQSRSRIIKSWDTSTKRLVKYPESAVRRAVSESPLRAPWAEIKYSNTSRPSRKLDLMGSSIVLPVVSAMSPRIPASCLICLSDPRAPESAIMKMLL